MRLRDRAGFARCSASPGLVLAQVNCCIARCRQVTRSVDIRKGVGFMTAILVVLTIAVFLSIDALRGRRAARALARSRQALEGVLGASPIVIPEGVFLGEGHTWAHLENDGSVRVGIDDFARRLLGRIDRIELAPPGTSLGRRDAAFVLHQHDKSVAFAAPITGWVSEVNAAGLGWNGGRFGSEWLLRLEPKRLAEDLRHLRVGDPARRWLRDEVARLRDFLAGETAMPAMAATLQDGGHPVEGLFEQLDERAWERFESEFLARQASQPAGGGAS
jgi:glycine cleavage system H lipoate-binding protein